MARKDWIYIGISSYLVDGIDAFLKSDGAKIRRIDRRQQFVNRLILEWFANYHKKTGIVLLEPFQESEKVPGLLDFETKKSKK